jgi:hypothetical protein
VVARSWEGLGDWVKGGMKEIWELIEMFYILIVVDITYCLHLSKLIKLHILKE